MNNRNTPTSGRTVLDPTEARQASPRRMNLRVLIGSMVGLIAIGAVLLFVFFKATPPGMDATPTGAEIPASTAPAAPEAKPAVPAPAP